MPVAVSDIENCLDTFEIEELIRGGRGEAPFMQRPRKSFSDAGWQKRNIHIRKLVDERETQSLSHEIDHVKAFDGGTVALEIEWNNKDPFFDRDLENFQRLHAQGAVSVGVIITRGKTLQADLYDLVLKFARSRRITSFEDLEVYDYNPANRQKNVIDRRVEHEGISFAQAWRHVFVADKFGKATTHWNKLSERVNRGVSSPSPLLLIGISNQIIRL